MGEMFRWLLCILLGMYCYYDVCAYFHYVLTDGTRAHGDKGKFI